MNPLRALLLLAAIVSSAYGYCYDAQVATDQYFDDSFVYGEKLPYPAHLIESDLNNLQDYDLFYFLDTATSCFNETGYFTRNYVAEGDYKYECVCPSPRVRIDAVYVKQNVCFVVYPEMQDIQYAHCGGHCSFDYRTMISTASRGYYCVYQSFVKRDFLVWCPKVPITVSSQSGSGALSGAFAGSGAVSGAGRVGRSVPQQGVYQPNGHFLIMSKKLPTLCSCRGYFCDHHAAAVH